MSILTETRDSREIKSIIFIRIFHVLRVPIHGELSIFQCLPNGTSLEFLIESSIQSLSSECSPLMLRFQPWTHSNVVRRLHRRCPVKIPRENISEISMGKSTQ